jgi:hypothetical protein
VFHRGYVMRRRIRPLSLLLVALVHVLVLGLVLVERHFMPERSLPEQLVYILPITLRPAREVTPEPPETRPESSRRSAPMPAPLTEPQEPSTTAIETAPITPDAPRIDWQRELELSARSFAEPAEPTRPYRSLNSKPKALQLPQPDDAPVYGETATLPNGDRITRFEVGETLVTCVSRNSLDEAFSVWAKFRPPSCGVRRKPVEKIPEPKPRSYLGPALPLGQPGHEERGSDPR